VLPSNILRFPFSLHANINNSLSIVAEIYSAVIYRDTIPIFISKETKRITLHFGIGSALLLPRDTRRKTLGLDGVSFYDSLARTRDTNG